MPDWTQSMQQTFEYYLVDPHTWGNKKRLRNVLSSTVTNDLNTETLSTASFNVTEDVGEQYIRTYLVTVQNGRTERFPLGTHLVQTPSSKFDGKASSVSLDAYSPLLELKDVLPPIGYTAGKNENIMDLVYNLAKANMRGPVVPPSCDEQLYSDFVAESNETMLSYIATLAKNAKFRLSLDELSRLLFQPIQQMESMQPVWTYSVDEKSILYSDINSNRDLYGIPNVLEVIYSDSNGVIMETIENHNSDSPISIENRGRKVMQRDTSPSLPGMPTKDMIKEYAERSLENLSQLEYKITYKHGYCPVRVGDAVRINYEAAGLRDVKAVVTSQVITCDQGCSVEETAVYTKKLWERD